MSAPDFKTCYDFSPIETAVETLVGRQDFVIAWLGGKAAVAFQKPRPRVESYLSPGNPFGSPPHYHNTIDGARRINGWQGSLRTMIVTPTVSGKDEAESGRLSYEKHWEFRSAVAAFMATIDFLLANDSELLPYHQVARCWAAGDDPKIAPDTGVYVSQLNHNLIYSIRPTAWPGGITNA